MNRHRKPRNLKRVSITTHQTQNKKNVGEIIGGRGGGYMCRKKQKKLFT